MRSPPPLRYPAAVLAGLLAWAAVGLELWSGPVQASGFAAAWPVPALARGLHLLFAPAFVLSWRLRERRARLAAASGLTVLALGLVALYRYNSAAALLILPMIEFAALLGPRALAAAFALSNAALFGVVWLAREMDAPWTYVGVHAALQAFAILLLRSARRTERAHQALAQSHADLLAARGMLAEAARSEERLRLSRELHDVAGHKLTALRLNLSALQYHPGLDREQALARCSQLSAELLEDLRAVVQQLRLHDGLDLEPSMRALAGAFPQLRLHLRLDPDARAPGLDQAEALLRAFQEGLTNAVRHGQAQTLWASLQRDGQRLALELRDDGRGAPAGQLAGNGLTGMRERLLAVGGGLDFGAGDNGGFRLRGWVPLC